MSDKKNEKKSFTYVDELDAVLLDGVQCDGDVLQGVGLCLRGPIVPQLPTLEYLH
jgi:hypothetical protein